MTTTSFVAALALTTLAGVASAQCSAEKTACKSTEKLTAREIVAEDADKELAEKDIVDTAVAAGNFKTLAAALQAAGLVDALKAKGPFTVFAPTDDAFAKLPKGTLETLLKPENKHRLQSILKYHVLSGNVMAKDVKTMPAETLDGQRIDLKVSGKSVTVDSAKVTATDIAASNGVIHVIDTVLLPSDKNIVQTAAAESSFKTLATLLEKADLVSALSAEGPFTVFAPTDDAFAKLPKETVDNLLKPENKAQLQAILKYHVVKGRVFSDAAIKAGHAKTLQGADVKVTTGKSDKGSHTKTVMINDAKVTMPDVDAANGVIHAIDTVLIPK